MITKPTVDLLRAAWQMGVQAHLDEQIEIVMNALIVATDPISIAALQGKARAFKSMQRFPEYISQFVQTEVPEDATA